MPHLGAFALRSQTAECASNAEAVPRRRREELEREVYG